MKSHQNRRKLTKSVLIVIIVLPVFLLGILSISPSLNKLTKNITVVSAGMTFWSGQNGQDSNQIAVKTPLKEDKAEESEVKTVNLSFDDTKALSGNPLWNLELAPEEIETPLPPEELIQQPSTDISEMIQALPYPTSIEEHSGVIKQMSYTEYSGSQFFNLETAGQVRNCTSVSNKTLIEESYKLPEFKIELNGEPQVLIMHTHTTESFEPYEREFYDASFNSRSTDTTKNVVAVGDAIEQELLNAGIGVIHDTTVHDYPQYNGSYQRSRETVQKILEENPSIKVVLDIHRDAIQSSNGVRNAPVATINGQKAAQVMIISGCDDGTMGMPSYMKNFRFASLLQQQLSCDYIGLTRPVLFDYRKYNQDLTTGSLLLEIGSHGNSVEQAVYSGHLVGKSLAKSLMKCS